MVKLAFVFPGQGSQSVGMLDSIAERPAVAAVLADASAALGDDLATLIHAGPSEQLNLTINTQPAMLTAGYAFYTAWRDAGGREPELVAGHSLGEYTALTVAGSLTLVDAVKTVRFRASAMQQAVPAGEGAMAAILGLDDDQVRAACAAVREAGVVEAVNFNAPSQVVIAGTASAVDRACEEARRRGAKRAVTLPVSAPFHSSLLRAASDRLRDYLRDVSIDRPRIPVINNVDVAAETDPAAIVDALARQAASPVRWVETIQAMANRGATHIVECGPGRVLAGLTRRIAPQLQSIAIHDAASLAAAVEQLEPVT
jgi:[acyl-carrier-protein] S-malonyltransferase